VPARTLATVMILQAHEGLSDQEACDRLECDLRWQAAARVDAGAESFHPTTLVGLRNRLWASGRPRRLVTDTKTEAGEAGVMGNRVRVADSTPIYDAVATQDTVTLFRSAIRKLSRSPACPVTARMRRTRPTAPAGPARSDRSGAAHRHGKNHRDRLRVGSGCGKSRHRLVRRGRTGRPATGPAPAGSSRTFRRHRGRPWCWAPDMSGGMSVFPAALTSIPPLKSWDSEGLA